MWIAIENTKDGELMHGVSDNLSELERRALKQITRSAFEELLTADERARIGHLKEAGPAAAGLSVEERAILGDACMVEVIGSNRAQKFYDEVVARYGRVTYQREDSDEGVRNRKAQRDREE